MSENELRNAKQLFRVLSFQVREREEESLPYEEDKKVPSTNWDYEFSYSQLRNEALLIGMCKKSNFPYKIRRSGVLVFKTTNKFINEARERCNKTAFKMPIYL